MTDQNVDDHGVVVVVMHRTRPGQRAEVRSVWEKHMPAAIDSNSGHRAYYYGLDAGDPDAITAVQHYRSAQDAAAFLRTPAYMAYEREVAPLLVGAPEVRRLTPTWIKPSA